MQLSAADTTTPDTSSQPAPWYAAPLTALTSVYSTMQLNKINVQRLQQGLPALAQSELAPTVNVGLPPDQLKKILLFGGAAVVGILAVVAMKRR